MTTPFHFFLCPQQDLIVRSKPNLVRLFLRTIMQILFTVTTLIDSIIDLLSFYSCLLNVYFRQFFFSPFPSILNFLSYLPLIIHLSILLPVLLPLSFIFAVPFFHLAYFPSAVFAGAGVWGESGDNRWRLHSRREKCDYYEPPYPSGLDVPVVLSAQVQLSSSGEDLPQGCPESCAWLWWVTFHFLYTPFLTD